MNPKHLDFLAVEKIANTFFCQGDLDVAELLFGLRNYYRKDPRFSQKIRQYSGLGTSVKIPLADYFMTYCVVHHHYDFLFFLQRTTQRRWDKCILNTAARVGAKPIFDYLLLHLEIAGYRAKLSQVQFLMGLALPHALVSNHFDLAWYFLDHGANLSSLDISHYLELIKWLYSGKYLEMLFKRLLFILIPRFRIQDSEIFKYRMIWRALDDLSQDSLPPPAKNFLKLLLSKKDTFLSIQVSQGLNIIL
jgi:hypothetical protein